MDSYLAIKTQDFAHPWDVVLDQELSADQKRRILASWASDAAAVESRPAFRWLKGTPGPVPLSHIRSALLAVDRAEMQPHPTGHLRAASSGRRAAGYGVPA